MVVEIHHNGILAAAVAVPSFLLILRKFILQNMSHILPHEAAGKVR
jgi:hypothetical protein